MKKLLFLVCFFSTHLNAQSKIPQWFVNDLTNNVGTWVTDNKEYLSDKEKFDAYGMHWQWGIGENSITGVLYGITNGKKSNNFWEFRQYWDGANQQGVLVQYGGSGVMGIGNLKQIEKEKIEIIQTFSLPSGQKWQSKHISENNGTTLETLSFNFNKEDKKWIDDRHYKWNKVKENTDSHTNLGQFSHSLSVKNIKASYVFYQKLGFKKIDGSIEQHWLMLKNNESKIGLFQGMFPENTITFNPINGRVILEQLKQQGIKPKYSNGLDKTQGPMSFSINDPDGNPILIDQH